MVSFVCTHIERYFALALNIVKYIIERRKQLHVFISSPNLCKPHYRVCEDNPQAPGESFTDLNEFERQLVRSTKEHTYLRYFSTFYWGTQTIKYSIGRDLATVTSYRVEEREV